jgi:hypothetical protein
LKQGKKKKRKKRKRWGEGLKKKIRPTPPLTKIVLSGACNVRL